MITKALGCLAVGLVVTVALAWTSAGFAPEPSPVVISGGTFNGPGYWVWLVDVSDSRHGTRVLSRWQGSGTALAFMGRTPENGAADVLPEWATEVRPDANPPRQDVTCRGIADVRGWPWPALRGAFVESTTEAGETTRATHGAIMLRSAAGEPAAFLPCTVVLGGLIADTVFHALLAAVILRLPGALRRWRRRKRGACPACGYDMRGTDNCPECGAAQNP